MAVRVLIGQAFGLRSPVSTYAETLYLDVRAKPGATLELGQEFDELAIYGVHGALTIDGANIEPGKMAILAPRVSAKVEASNGARYVVIGGESLDGPRHVWWNFVSTRKERIEQAKGDWQARRMGTVPGDSEWIPLPS